MNRDRRQSFIERVDIVKAQSRKTQRRKSFGSFVDRRRKSFAQILTPRPKSESDILKEKLAQKTLMYQRQKRQFSERLRCAEDIDEVPYDKMGTIAVVGLISILLLFALLAHLQETS